MATGNKGETLRHNHNKVCVTGGSGYVASFIIKKLLENGHTVHSTLRNLEDRSKVGLLKSLPNADTKLVLFKADIYNPEEFEAAIEECEFVFHVASPMQVMGLDPSGSAMFKDMAEATVGALKSIADYCAQSQTVKRLIYTSTVMACSSLNEDGVGFKGPMNEFHWTPLHLSFTYSSDFTLQYTIGKTLADKEALSYNEIEGGKLEVVTLACALVGGETILTHLPSSVGDILSQLTEDPVYLDELRFLQELLGSVPLVHVEDVCDAHIFCMEKPSIKGRFLVSAASPTMREIGRYFEENYPQLKIDERNMGEGVQAIMCDSTKLTKEGFEYKYDMKKILDDSLRCGKRLGGLN